MQITDITPSLNYGFISLFEEGFLIIAIIGIILYAMTRRSRSFRVIDLSNMIFFDYSVHYECCISINDFKLYGIIAIGNSACFCNELLFEELFSPAPSQMGIIGFFQSFRANEHYATLQLDSGFSHRRTLWQ